MPPDQLSSQKTAYDTLKAAVLGSNLQSPEVNSLFSIDRASGDRIGANAPSNFNTGVTVNNQEIARQNQIDDLKAQAQAAAAANDPSKYQQVAKKDGGYAFYDGAGQEISAWDYARATGKSPADLLKGSLNPVDKAFSQDWAQLQNYMTDKANSKNDSKAAARAKKTEQQVKKYYNIDLHKQDPNQVTQTLMAAYPTVFGGTAKGRQGTNTLLPSAATLKTSLGGGGL